MSEMLFLWPDLKTKITTLFVCGKQCFHLAIWFCFQFQMATFLSKLVCFAPD